MSSWKQGAAQAVCEAAGVIGVASLVVGLAEPYIGAENVTPAYRAMLGAYLIVRSWMVVQEVRKELQGDGE